jgi:hypothetical protein
MNPYFWGPPVWQTIHIVAFTYPEKPSREDKSDAKNFMKFLALNLPCSICQRHMLDAVLKGIPSFNLKPLNSKVLSGRLSFFKWTYDFHNYVNLKKVIPKGTKRKKNKSFRTVINFYNSKLIDKSKKLKI